jgi:5-methylcytosine-specific restriction protein A
MRELDIVFSDYLPNSQVVSEGKSSRRRLIPGTALPVDQCVTETLPQLLTEMVEASGRDSSNYKIYGSVGQMNWTLAYIPWVAILRKEISSSTERGYYVVLLFSQDMQSCYLSLNQGFTQFKNAFGESVGTRKVFQAAKYGLKQVTCPDAGYIKGLIDISATNALGIGYQNGAIVSRRYQADQDIQQNEFAKDLAVLLDLYDELFSKIGANLIDAMGDMSSDEYQEVANEIAKSPPGNDLPEGGLPLPKQVASITKNNFKRDPKMAALAIAASKYSCEIDAGHETFTSRRTKERFVEAHHLIPMQYQGGFSFSLDIPENIVALCPTCHRKFHHSRFGELKPILNKLFADRLGKLKSREIKIELPDINEMYRGDVEED